MRHVGWHESILMSASISDMQTSNRNSTKLTYYSPFVLVTCPSLDHDYSSSILPAVSVVNQLLI